MLNNIKNKINLMAFAVPAFAQETIRITPKDGSQFQALQELTAGGIISGAIGLVLLLVALVFFFILVIGGLKWVTSGGDEKKVGAARAQITNALIGLAIVFAAWAIMKLIGTVFGIDILGDIQIPTFK